MNLLMRMSNDVIDEGGVYGLAVLQFEIGLEIVFELILMASQLFVSEIHIVQYLLNYFHELMVFQYAAILLSFGLFLHRHLFLYVLFNAVWLLKGQLVRKVRNLFYLIGLPTFHILSILLKSFTGFSGRSLAVSKFLGG